MPSRLGLRVSVVHHLTSPDVYRRLAGFHARRWRQSIAEIGFREQGESLILQRGDRTFEIIDV